MHRVFLYGTLKRGQPNHHALEATATYLGRFQTQQAYPLVVGGQWFSPYLLPEPGDGLRVFGEVFRVSDEGLKRLDEIEGTHLPRGYRRASVQVVGKTASFDAFTYFKDRASIDGDISDPMIEYPLDPHYVIPSERTDVF